MNTRLVSGLILASGMIASGIAQQAPQAAGNAPQTQAAPATVSVATPIMIKQKLLNTVATYETMTRRAEQEHLPDLRMARLYWHLAMTYEDAGEIGRAEAALLHSETLFRRSDSSGGELSEVLDSLAILEGAVGDVSKAEKHEVEALQLRQQLGDRLLMARSWCTLTALALKQKKFDQAREYAQKAADEFAENNNATIDDKLAARYGLGMALCGQKNYTAAVPVLSRAVADAHSALSARSMSVGVGEFLLGYAYWKAGDITSAGVRMKTGMDILNPQLGWGAPSYLLVLRMYAKYLHATHNVADANEVNQRIQQAESVVSVGQLQSSPSVFGFAGLY